MFINSITSCYRPVHQSYTQKRSSASAALLACLVAALALSSPGRILADGQSDIALGKDLFANSQGTGLLACAACHAVDHALVGPSLQEIAKIYGNNPNGIVTWAKNPGKKRPNMIQMPNMAAVGDDKLRKIALYMISAGGGK